MKALQALLFAALAFGLSNAHAAATCTARLNANQGATDQAVAKAAANMVYSENVKPAAPEKAQQTSSSRR